MNNSAKGKIIYYAENQTEEKDRLPHLLIEKLKVKFPEIAFRHFDPSETVNFPKNLFVIDTVLGLKKIKTFQNLECFALSPRNSVHDYDLGLDLGLMKKLNKIKKLTIIGIPEKCNIQEAIEEISEIFEFEEV